MLESILDSISYLSSSSYNLHITQ
ncbi:hypothetical protein F383_38660 [Gossypium arboreum]|uniref:Uncharacterized protein n=1 Tax=Gossypium arboreum TaxID=29729 RepID=A0A0B0ML80_GOSAR|nr:hypothetical protein F383_38660 [Gossypium arboreum]